MNRDIYRTVTPRLQESLATPLDAAHRDRALSEKMVSTKDQRLRRRNRTSAKRMLGDAGGFAEYASDDD